MKAFKKCFISLSLSLGVTLAITAANSFAADAQKMIILNIDKPNMIVNGQSKEIDPGKGTVPQIQNSRTLVPIRSIIEEMGGKIDWDSSTRKVSLTLKDKMVDLWIDKDTAKVNGEDKKLDTAATIINERTMLPLRFVSENLGLYVNWDGSTKSVGISNFNDFVLSVAGENVNSKEYKYFLYGEKNYYAENAGVQIGKDFWTTPNKDGKTPFDIVSQNADNTCRYYKMLMKLIKDSNYTLSEEEQKSIKESLDNFVNQSGGEDKANQKAMEQNGVSLADKQEIAKNSLTISCFLRDSKNKLKTSDKEVQNFYEKNKSSFEKVTVQHILIMTIDSGTNAPLPQDKVAEAKKQAEDILAKVKAGEDFKELAKKYSQDPGSKDNGGEYTFPKGQMVKAFEDWSFNAKPGDIGIIKSEYGYHVMKFVKKLTIEDMKDDIINAYYGQYQQELFDKWEKDPQYQIVKNQTEIDAIK
ncbi:MAG TPA: stalk domain-containing protein [Clostridia bacterium]